MTGLVLDASAITELLLDDEHAGKLHIFLLDRNEGERWLAPEFCLLECTNAIWKGVRNNRLTREDSLVVMSSLHGFPLQCIESREYLDESLSIALRHGLPVYDSCYLRHGRGFWLPAGQPGPQATASRRRRRSQPDQHRLTRALSPVFCPLVYSPAPGS